MSKELIERLLSDTCSVADRKEAVKAIRQLQKEHAIMLRDTEKTLERTTDLAVENERINRHNLVLQKRLEAAERVNAKTRELIEDDDFAMTVLNMGQYRNALLGALHTTADPHSTPWLDMARAKREKS